MALSLCSCAVLLASCRASADTRTGQADGYGGILRVQVMMEDGAISAVNILEQHETDGIGSRALDILPDEMIRMAELWCEAGYYDLCKSTWLRCSGRCIFHDTEGGRQVTGTWRSRNNIWRKSIRWSSCIYSV